MGFPVIHGEATIHGDAESGFTLAFRGQWIAGIYDSVETAKGAAGMVARGNEDWITRLWNGRGDHRVITQPMLRVAERIELWL